MGKYFTEARVGISIALCSARGPILRCGEGESQFCIVARVGLHIVGWPDCCPKLHFGQAGVNIALWPHSSQGEGNYCTVARLRTIIAQWPVTNIAM